MGLVPVSIGFDHAGPCAFLFPQDLGIDVGILQKQQQLAVFDLEVGWIDRKLFFNGMTVGALTSERRGELVRIRLEGRHLGSRREEVCFSFVFGVEFRIASFGLALLEIRYRAVSTDGCVNCLRHDSLQFRGLVRRSCLSTPSLTPPQFVSLPLVSLFFGKTGIILDRAGQQRGSP